MARLCHLRYVSIGHPNARCDDLTIPLLDANGSPVDSTIWLRNAGGKSQTLTLFYSLVRPRKRDFLGHTADGTIRQLSDYVLKDDAALVIAEWELDSEQPTLLPLGDRLITGVFYERGDIAVEGDDGERRVEIDKLFFAMRSISADSATTLSGIPIYEDEGHRQRRKLKQFRRMLETVRERTPAAQVTITREIGEWEDLLRSYALDPELFQYQLKMNAAEGGATRIFQDRRTIRDFIDLFLEILVDREFGERIHTHLEQHREHLRRRALEFEPGLALVDQLLPLAAQFRDLHEERRRARAHGDSARIRALALASYGGARQVALDEQVVSQRVQAAEADLAARTRREDARLHRFNSAALRRDIAILAVRNETAVVEQLHVQLREAIRERDLWDAAIVLRDHDHHLAEAHRYRQALERREAEARPLLQAVQSAADDYAAALLAQIQELERQQGNAERERAEAQASEELAGKEHTNWTVRQSVAKNAAASARRSAEKMEHDRTRLISAHVLERDESPTAAQRRLGEALTLSRTEVEKQAALVAAREQAAAAAHTDAERAKDERFAIERALGEVTRRIAEAEAEANTFAKDARLLSLLELESVEALQLDQHAAGLVHEAASREVERLLLARMELAQRNRDLSALEATGLLPDSSDVVRVLSRLASSHVTAHSGWHYLAETSRPDIARALLNVFPDMANSVVVPDAHFANAQLALAGPSLDVDGPVAVLRQATVVNRQTNVTPSQAACPDLVVLPARDIHFDRAAGKAFVPAMRTRVEQCQSEADIADAERSAFDLLYARLTSFLSRRSPQWFVTERAEATRQRLALATAREREVKQGEVAEGATSALETARKGLENAKALLLDTDGQRHRLADFVERWGTDLGTFDKQIQDAEAAITVASSECSRIAKERDSHAARRSEAEGRLRELAVRIGIAGREATDIKYVRGGVGARPGDTSALRNAYEMCLAEYEGKVGRDAALRLAEQAEKNAKALIPRLDQKRKNVHVEQVRAKLATIADPSMAEDEHERAQTEYHSCFGLHGNRSQSLQRLEADADSIIVESTKVGLPSVDRATRMAELPTDDGTLNERWRRERSALEQQAADADAEAEDLERLVQLANESLAESKGALVLVQNGIKMLEAITQPAAALLGRFADSQDAVAKALPHDDHAFVDAIGVLRDDVTSLREAWERLDKLQRDNTARMRGLLGQPAYMNLDDAMFRRLRSAEGDDLESNAQEIDSDLTLRRTHLVQAIADLDRHLNDLIQLTLAAADEGRRLLRLATLRSELPSHFPAPLGGRPFLKISHVEPSKDAEADRGAAKQLVETWVRSDKSIPGSLALLQGAVHTILPSIHVQILFPDAAKQQVRMDPISALGSYSGGEKLTSATLIYCTLARVRAQKRGAVGHGTNVLLCDNPQGTSSLPTLLTWQREVASALGVQLVYFTGIEDLEAIRVMPNTVRIENSRYDGRTNQQVLEIAGETNPSLEALRLVRSEAQYPILAPKPNVEGATKAGVS